MIRILCVLALLAVARASAEEIIDYLDQLDAQFTRGVTVNSVQITTRPRLIEREFAVFVKDQLEKKATRQAILKAWVPRYYALQREGYVFNVEFLLLNQNLDANVEVPLAGDLRRHVLLVNSKGETGMAYKIVGDAVSKLDFMYPKKTLVCYFNTVNPRGVPLLRKGITSLKLVVSSMGPSLPNTSISWDMPLFYGETPRPQPLSSRFGPKVFRTLIPLQSNVWHRVDLAPEISRAPAAPQKPAAAQP
jgi:hypothetical protein